MAKQNYVAAAIGLACLLAVLAAIVKCVLVETAAFDPLTPAEIQGQLVALPIPFRDFEAGIAPFSTYYKVADEDLYPEDVRRASRYSESKESVADFWEKDELSKRPAEWARGSEKADVKYVLRYPSISGYGAAWRGPFETGPFFLLLLDGNEVIIGYIGPIDESARSPANSS